MMTKCSFFLFSFLDYLIYFFQTTKNPVNQSKFTPKVEFIFVVLVCPKLPAKFQVSKVFFLYNFLDTKISINRSKFTPKSDNFYVNFLYLQSFLQNFHALAWHVSPPFPSVCLHVRPYVPLKKSYLLLLVLISALDKIFGVSHI